MPQWQGFHHDHPRPDRFHGRAPPSQTAFGEFGDDELRILWGREDALPRWWVTEMTHNTAKRRGMSPHAQPASRDGYRIVGRQTPSKGTAESLAAPESQYEKQMILPTRENLEPRDHAWAEARFAVDIMAEHALFFSLLMPEELAPDEKAKAKQFHDQYTKLFARIDSKGPPTAGDLKGFVRDITTAIQPIIDYKEENHRRQVDGTLQSLVWPLFFDHTRREAVRWVRRMDDMAEGNVQLERREVVDFWGGIMDEHARFVAHLLDPEERDLVAKAFRTSDVFEALRHGHGGPARALAKHPIDTASALIEHPELDAVESAAETILEFKTDTVRKLETAQIKSIIHPILADHVRREAVKFLDELRRTKQD